MIIENKAVKTLDFGNPQNLHPLYAYWYISYATNDIQDNDDSMGACLIFYTSMHCVLPVIKQSTTYATEFVFIQI